MKKGSLQRWFKQGNDSLKRGKMQNHDQLPIDKGRRVFEKKDDGICYLEKDPMNDKKCLCSIVRPPSSSKSILSKLNLDTIIDVITTVANQKYHHYSSRFLEGNLKVMTHFKNYSMDTKG